MQPHGVVRCFAVPMKPGKRDTDARGRERLGVQGVVSPCIFRLLIERDSALTDPRDSA